MQAAMSAELLQCVSFAAFTTCCTAAGSALCDLPDLGTLRTHDPAAALLRATACNGFITAANMLGYSLKDQCGLLTLVGTACKHNLSRAVWSALATQLVKSLQQANSLAAAKLLSCADHCCQVRLTLQKLLEHMQHSCLKPAASRQVCAMVQGRQKQQSSVSS